MNLEQQIEATMVRAAEGIGPADFTADEILHKGRTAWVRRHTRRTAVGVAAVVLAAVATVTVSNLPGRGAQFQNGPTPSDSPSPTASGWPFPTSPAQSGTPPQDLGIAIANGSELVTAQGRFKATLPPLTYITRAQRVIGGWVVTTVTAGTHQIDAWFQPTFEATPTRLASPAWETDGIRLIVVDDSGTTLTAYLLPSMEKIAQTRIEPFGTPGVIQIQFVDGTVYAIVMNGDLPLRTERWDLNTNVLTPLAKTVMAWGQSGDSLLRVTRNGTTSCVDIVSTNRFEEGGTSGLCSVYLARSRGSLSPDGKRVVFTTDNAEPDLLVNAADLHAGVWRPTTITAARHFIGWDRSSAFLAYGDGNTAPILRCTAADTCAPIGLSPGDPLVFIVTDNLS